MVCALRLLIIFASISTSFAAEGPCSRKLLGVGDRAEDTSAFTMYLEMLLTDRTISVQDLDPFVSSLEKNKIINPIPSHSENKTWTFHHDEFEDLLKSGPLDISKIKAWAQSFISRAHAIENQQAHTNQETVEIPYVAFDGTVFLKINDPLLGKAYKIGSVIWPLNVIESSGVTNNIGIDISNHNLVSKNSNARQFCLKLGDGYDLPTKEDYIEMMSHFEHESGKTKNKLTNKGFEEINRAFPSFYKYAFWTSSIDPSEQDYKGNPHRWVFSPYNKNYFLGSSGEDYQTSFICIKKSLETKPE